MSLRDLIRGPAPRKAATAIPATLAKVRMSPLPTVAGIATVAVAERPKARPAPQSVATIATVAVVRPSPTEADGTTWDATDWQAYFCERAAILEFDGGLPRAEAEARAWECCIAEWMFRNPIRSDPSRCNVCGENGMGRAPLLYGTNETVRAWLHGVCWSAWHEDRKLEAVAALRALGGASHG